MDPFRKLATELKLMILKQAEPGDLHSLVKASPALFETYCAFQREMFEGCLANAMEPEALQAALALADFTSGDSAGDQAAGSAGTSENSTTTSSSEAAELDAYGNPKRRTFTFPSDIPSLLRMCRKHKQVSAYVQGFADYATHNIRDILSNLSAELGQKAREGLIFDASIRQKQNFEGPISLTERTRIERAFYRHDTYSRIYPSSKEYRTLHAWEKHAHDENITRRLIKYSLRPSQDWEVEEILCVHHYLRVLAKGSIRESRSDLIKAALAASASVDSESPGALGSLEFNAINGPYSSSPPEQYLDFLALGGLDFMSKLLNADAEQRDHMIVKMRRPSRSMLWEGRGLKMTPEARQKGAIITAQDEGVEWGEDGKHCGTFGFRAVNDGRKWAQSWNDKNEEALWEAGYVFWDADRLRGEGMIGVLKKMRFWCDREIHRKWYQGLGAKWGEAPAERLRWDVHQMPVAALEVLKWRFGLPGDDDEWYGDFDKMSLAERRAMARRGVFDGS